MNRRRQRSIVWLLMPSLLVTLALPAARAQAPPPPPPPPAGQPPTPSRSPSPPPPAAPRPPAPPAPAQGDRAWPRQFAGDGHVVTVYQPQIEKWEGNTIEARAAVSVETVASPQQHFGVVWFAAQTQVDRENRLVALDQVKVARVNFPNAPEKASEYTATMIRNLPRAVVTVSLDRLQASLAIAQAETKGPAAQALKNDPPRIFYSQTPALLILIDGQPVFRPVEGTKLRRAINTRALIVLDETTGKHYLRVLSRWAEARALEGPWVIATKPPASLETARQVAAKTGQVDQLDNPGPGVKEAAAQGAYPVIYVSTTPAELLQTEGRPEYEPVGDLQLLHVKNSRSSILLDPATNEHYVLISGRWFRSKSPAKGPWEYVPHDRLPPDFAKIPETHPRGTVLASVPGTPQAQEAVIDNSIPQTATVDRANTKLSVTYDGSPQLKPIEGTTLQYVVNAPHPVILVDAANVYAVKDAVWFVAPSLNGPWAVATSVPAVIYTIPASSPMHYVTYVRVYGSTPQVVYVGYTPGYYGTVIAPTTVVVYGTGYYYPPYVGAYYYPYPPTYGYGAGFAWGAFTGFTFGLVVGGVWGGAHVSHHDVDIDVDRNVNINRDNVYDRWGDKQVKSKVQDRVGNLSPEQRQKLQQDMKARNAGRPSQNDVIAGRDGNTYRRGQEGWEQRGDKDWDRANLDRDAQQGLDREQRARSAGEARDRGVAQNRASQASRPAGGVSRPAGGVSRGGGGGRGRR
ncbi:MAG TPA: DUF3300 domain-containing protein [Methylomirabilota bacterium]|nr:DUF3300 domain-containing protein [Methylomirabilota bacterium]